MFLGPIHTYRIFLNPQLFLSGYGYRPHASGEFDSESGHFSIRPPEWEKISPQRIACGRVNPDIFESDDVANSCPISYRTINQYGGTTATTGQICRHYRTLYGACSKHILLQMSPWNHSESEYYRMRVDRRIRFEYATCGRGLSFTVIKDHKKAKNIQVERELGDWCFRCHLWKMVVLHCYEFAEGRIIYAHWFGRHGSCCYCRHGLHKISTASRVHISKKREFFISKIGDFRLKVELLSHFRVIERQIKKEKKKVKMWSGTNILL